LPLYHHGEVESLGLLAEPAVEYTGSFLVFNRACPTRAIPAFGPDMNNIHVYNFNEYFCKRNVHKKKKKKKKFGIPLFADNRMPMTEK
jgi:hypothetical protein